MWDWGLGHEAVSAVGYISALSPAKKQKRALRRRHQRRKLASFTGEEALEPVLSDDKEFTRQRQVEEGHSWERVLTDRQKVPKEQGKVSRSTRCFRNPGSALE